jgi:large conductance mechanosensitive channel
MGFISEFNEFLREYKAMALAIAFIMGIAITALVQSLVNDIIMPIITPFIPGGGWQTATVVLGPIVLRLGSFVGAVINFIVIALVIFMIAKFIMKEEKATKK